MKKSQNSWKRRILLFFISQSITLFGSQLVQMAVLWYITLQTDCGGWIAAFSVFSYLPQFFISFIGGVMADRRNKKHLILVSDGLIAAVTFLMILLMPHLSSEPVFLTALLLMSFLRAAGAGIQNPAVQAAVSQLVPEEHRMQYNGIYSAMQSFVQLTAPAAAALILTSYSLKTTLMADILTAILGMGILCSLSLPTEKNQEDPSFPLDEISVGIRYACSSGTISKTLLIYSLFLFFTVPAGYLSGLYVSRVYGNTYWYLTAVELAGFGGMMAGGLLLSFWKHNTCYNTALTAGLTLFGTMAAAMGLVRHFPIYLIFMVLYGIALTIVQTALTAMIQKNAEASMTGRVFGLMNSLYSVCYPAGMMVFGALADKVPLQWSMIVSGAALLILSCFSYWDRELKTDRF